MLNIKNFISMILVLVLLSPSFLLASSDQFQNMGLGALRKELDKLKKDTAKHIKNIETTKQTKIQVKRNRIALKIIQIFSKQQEIQELQASLKDPKKPKKEELLAGLKKAIMDDENFIEELKKPERREMDEPDETNTDPVVDEKFVEDAISTIFGKWIVQFSNGTKNLVDHGATQFMALETKFEHDLEQTVCLNAKNVDIISAQPSPEVAAERLGTLEALIHKKEIEAPGSGSAEGSGEVSEPEAGEEDDTNDDPDQTPAIDPTVVIEPEPAKKPLVRNPSDKPSDINGVSVQTLAIAGASVLVLSVIGFLAYRHWPKKNGTTIPESAQLAAPSSSSDGNLVMVH